VNCLRRRELSSSLPGKIAVVYLPQQGPQTSNIGSMTEYIDGVLFAIAVTRVG
jgi:hypothetical protein